MRIKVSSYCSGWHNQCVRQLNKAIIPEFLAEHSFSVIHLDAEWDGYRQMVAAKFELIEINTPDVGFGYVDVDREKDFASETKVLNVPMVLYYRGNNLIAAVIGQMQNIAANVAKLRSGEKIETANTISRF